MQCDILQLQQKPHRHQDINSSWANIASTHYASSYRSKFAYFKFNNIFLCFPIAEFFEEKCGAEASYVLYGFFTSLRRKVCTINSPVGDYFVRYCNFFPCSPEDSTEHDGEQAFLDYSIYNSKRRGRRREIILQEEKICQNQSAGSSILWCRLREEFSRLIWVDHEVDMGIEVPMS